MRDELRDAILRCSSCIFIATSDSLESGWCQAEIGAFWGVARPVIVYLTDDGLTEDKLPKQFKGDKFASTIREVVVAAKLYAGQSPERLQIEAVYGLAVEAFLNKLTYRLKSVWFAGFGNLFPGLNEEPTTVRWTNAFGKRVRYDAAQVNSNTESELKALVAQIAGLRRRREREIRKGLIGLFVDTQGQSQIIPRYLGMIRFGSGTLAEPWFQMQDGLLQKWNEKAEEFAAFDSLELERLRGFLEGHPAYTEVYEREKATIDAVLLQGRVTVDDFIEFTRVELVEFVKRISTQQPAAKPEATHAS